MSQKTDFERLNKLKRTFEEQGGDFVSLWNSVGAPDGQPDEAANAALNEDQIERLEEELESEIRKKKTRRRK